MRGRRKSAPHHVSKQGSTTMIKRASSNLTCYLLSERLLSGGENAHVRICSAKLADRLARCLHRRQIHRRIAGLAAEIPVQPHKEERAVFIRHGGQVGALDGGKVDDFRPCSGRKQREHEPRGESYIPDGHVLIPPCSQT